MGWSADVLVAAIVLVMGAVLWLARKRRRTEYRRAFSIRFVLDEKDFALTHGDVRNFGEDLHGLLEQERLGTVENTDTAYDEIFVSLAATHHRERVRQRIEKTLDTHSLREASSVTEE